MGYRTINELYLMECQGYVKIGIAQCSESRRRLLQTGNPFPITLIQALECPDPQTEESNFHRKYSEYRVRGEWFKLPPQILHQLIFETNQDVRDQPPKQWHSCYKSGDGPPDPEYWNDPQDGP